MHEVRQDFLEGSLRHSRFGSLIRAKLTPENEKRVRGLARPKGVYVKDVFRLFFLLYRAVPDKFPTLPVPKTRVCVAFRVPPKMAKAMDDIAWQRCERRSNFLNDLVEGAYTWVQEETIEKMLRDQVEKAVRVIGGQEWMKDRRNL